MSSKDHCLTRGMYFGRDGFWLSTCQGKELVERICAKWTDKGSKQLIRVFFSVTITIIGAILIYYVFN